MENSNFVYRIRSQQPSKIGNLLTTRLSNAAPVQITEHFCADTINALLSYLLPHLIITVRRRSRKKEFEKFFNFTPNDIFDTKIKKSIDKYAGTAFNADNPALINT